MKHTAFFQVNLGLGLIWTICILQLQQTEVLGKPDNPHLISWGPYKQPCETDRDCVSDSNPDDFLKCEYGEGGKKNCDCTDFTMIYYGKCLQTADGSCAENQTCVYHSSCLPNRYQEKACQCNEGYYEEKCYAGYGKKCSTDPEDLETGVCSSWKGLKCNPEELKCECSNSDENEWSTKYNRCIRKDRFNAPCKVDDDCLEGGDKFLECSSFGICKCFGDMKHQNGGCAANIGDSCSAGEPCILNANCNSDKVCECNPGYRTIKNNPYICFASHNTSCPKSGLCEPGLDCNNDEKVCKCWKEGELYEWSDDIKRCTPLIDWICKPSDRCPPKSTCKFVGDGGGMQCKCDPNHTSTKSNHCAKAYGAPCTTKNDSIPVQQHNGCNKDALLECSKDSQTCKCNSDSVYATVHERCRVKVGGQCDMKITHQFHLYRDCVTGAKCIAPPEDKNITVGTCECRLGLRPSSDKTTCGSDSSTRLLSNFVIAMALFLIYFGVPKDSQ